MDGLKVGPCVWLPDLKVLLRRRISVDEEKKVSTCSKIFSCIKLFFDHLFGHIGLTALVVSFLRTNLGVIQFWLRLDTAYLGRFLLLP